MGPLSCAGPAPAKSLGRGQGLGVRASAGAGSSAASSHAWGLPLRPLGKAQAQLGWAGIPRAALSPSRPTHLRLRCSPVPPQQPRGGLPGRRPQPYRPVARDWLLAAQSESTLRGPAFPSGTPEVGAVGNAPAPCIAASQARVAGTGSRAPGSRGTGLILPARLACPAGCPRSGSRPWVSAGRRKERPRKAGRGLGGPGTPGRVFLAARPPAQHQCLVHLPPASAFAHSLPSTCSICLEPRFPAASVYPWAVHPTSVRLSFA